MNVQYFKIKDTHQVTIHFYRLGNESIIQFMRSPHTLLALEFQPELSKINLNAYINGEPMRNDISIPMVHHLQNLRVKYNHRNQTCLIVQNNTTSNRCKIQDFTFDLVVAIQCQVHVSDIQNSKTPLSRLERFLSQASQLDSFQDVVEQMNGVNLHPEDFRKMLMQCSRKQSSKIEKYHKDIRQYMDIFSQNQMKMYDITTKEITSRNDTSSHTWPITLVNGKDNKTILLHKDHTIWLEDNEIGDWKAWKTSLWLAYDGKLIQLRWVDPEWKDQNSNSWFWSGDIASNDFLTKYQVSDEIVVVIITCFKKIQQATQQQNTWVRELQHLGIRCLFVAGDPSIKYPELTGNYLILPCEDSYECLPKKVFYAFSFVYRHYSFKYIYKVDDDAYVNGIYFMYLHRILDGHHYLGKGKTVGPDFNRYWHKGKCSKPHLNKLPYPVTRITPGVTYARGEAGYFLSREAIKSLFPYEQYIISDLYEDKVIGDCLEKEGYRLCQSPLYQTKLYEKFQKDRCLDRYGLIVDVPHQQFKEVQLRFKKSIYAIVG